MNGIEKITGRIEADAQEQAKTIAAEAEAKCAEIRADYDKQAQDQYWARVRDGVKACEDRVQRMGRLAEMEARKSVLALKQEMVSKSFDMACDMIVNLPAEQYVKLLAKLAANASVTGDEEIVLNAKDKAAVGDAVVKAANAALNGGKLALSDETGDFKGGLILRRGAIEANCTIERLVELCRGDMSAELAGVLFA